MSVPFKDVPGSPAVPDVAAIVQRVRSGVAEKLNSGILTPADLERARRIEREISRRQDLGPAPADDLADVQSSWDPLGPYTFTSHRAGAGRFVVAAKQWLRRLTRPVAAVTLARQSEFNGAVARLLTRASGGVLSLEVGYDELLRRLDELECRNRELDERCADLQAEVRGLEARLLDPDGRVERRG